ncbi:DEAD/DEAH box helicase [Brevibacterium luteolum]|uniref:DEAD/DEAH box helicase n=1 Tax=Brevibacterium luteolum TaxID=199591 RepID=UPI001C249A4B|nr:type ISP restriction/modification enzyme [Brevibacterium luteolum]MBU8578056.1 DEAD/DEAH box helicase family protein [Brevibacterium luteolum]MCT1872574.1 DEAD/DEAH box helicase family protein [Brevibacterium luteolum]MCT1890547.1 DEAD/DEAH box helicase family protein [Brevibacterium luteolum]MCT1893037.1 DEAD/DEAH box helicase family protein [Brevibacterium luteolum]MCT1923829.1 DEAD/DEAH box helicase family protein [Brevibacterium luteolum]
MSSSTELTAMKLLDKLYFSPGSQTEKGTRFERFTQSFLQTDPLWSEQFEKVWMWDQWPDRWGPDTGIDLVAQRRDGGKTAIQCKFYDPQSRVSKADIDTFLSASGRGGFTERIIVSTTTQWGPNAETAIRDQSIPVRRIGLNDFEQSRINWDLFDPATPTVLELSGSSDLRPYQRNAIDQVTQGFTDHHRGRLIMACGTGKTFTSLRLAEEYVGPRGTVLFLVPSIALLSQALREWTNNTDLGIAPLAVCSDPKATRGRKANDDTPEISVVDLALPATTDPHRLAERMKDNRTGGEGMRVVFATYQSIDVVAQAQQLAGLEPFDLVICDEAHRTTGATLAGTEESAFVRVHDEAYLKAEKRLYMTATPRIYDDASKAKAGKAQAVLASMDDEDVYGPEFFRLGFGDAVEMGMLTDYKVLILTVNQETVGEAMQEAFARDGELTLDDATRLIGCWNGLAKRGDAEHSFDLDPQPMRKAVAFARDIKSSKKVANQFTDVVSTYINNQTVEAPEDLLAVEAKHVDGSMNAMERTELLDWLKEDTNPNECRVLSNARCLSEGVDVPSLDAVMFLNPRRSVVDVVQSVGRVMRLAKGKKYGYIILPVVVPAGVAPEKALDDNKNFQVVWDVLQALRAHDERFDAMVNKVELNKKRDTKINVMGVGFGGEDDGNGGESAGGAEADSGSDDGSGSSVQGALDLRLSQMDELRDAIYARMVKKVGSRTYWDQWAKDIAVIAQNHITRITSLVDDPQSEASHQFEVFLDALRRNLNESITRDGAIEMVAQHMITKPVFDALFEGYAFTDHNPVSQVMDRMVDSLTAMHVDAEAESLESFYESVRLRAAGIDNAEGKQKIITELYESFFKNAFPRAADAMGVVYTPIEIVDFILRSVNDVLQQEFGRSISDEGVHVLDPFTGTGTFIVRLLQSGLIDPADLARKYASELHANEILLLAYYIAAINIETTFHDLQAQAHEVELDVEDYEPFSGIVLTDTFQLTEDGDLTDEVVFPANNTRAEAQKKLDIQVIVGNPPYSRGQTSGNDDNANVSYPTLDARVRDTFAARSDATNQNLLYDSYLRAIRWASDRIGSEGVIGFVTNGGWIEGNTAAGVRKTLAEEFSSIYVFNLRGNARTAGVLRQKEKGNVFGSGGRTTVAVFLLVRTQGHSGPATIHYRDIGDYLSREEKLAIVADSTLDAVPWQQIIPNRHGDWINQRDEDYLTYPILGDKKGLEPRGVAMAFSLYSLGVATGRDAWAYNFSHSALAANIRMSVDHYNAEVDRIGGTGLDPAVDPRLFAWNRNARNSLSRSRKYSYHHEAIQTSLYRPFTSSNLYFDKDMNAMQYSLRKVFPTAQHDNHGFYVNGIAAGNPFACLATRAVPCLDLFGKGGQFFPRYRWEPATDEGTIAFDLGGEVVDGYRRVDNITDDFHRLLQGRYGNQVTKDDVFFFLYGLLHSPEYRERYAGELKQMLPRVPHVPAKSFQPFVEAGRELFHLHADYEEADPYPLEIVGGEQADLLQTPDSEADYYRVQKMRFPTGKKAADAPDSLILNPYITVRGIPETAYRFQLGSRSAIEWIMRQYQVTTDKASGIVNDPNQWGIEHGNPRYILDLLQKVITVSVRTVEISERLPSIETKGVDE